jgi:hypothetical protein
VSEKHWKAVERAIAKHLGGQRNPVTGRPGQPDVVHPLLAVEVKTRRRLPTWLTQALAQAQRAARAGQLAIVVLHPHGTPHAEDLVVLSLATFCQLLSGQNASE